MSKDTDAADHFAKQYGPTFMKLAIKRAEAEGVSIADMTDEQLIHRAAALVSEEWRRQGTFEALLEKRRQAQ